MENQKTKVLYLCPNGYLGGAERAVLNICSGHRDSDHYEAVIYFFNHGEAVEMAHEMGLDNHVMPFPFKLSSPLRLMKACGYLRNYIERNDFEIIHSTMPYAHIVCFLATFLLGIKRVWFQHGPVGGVLDRLACLLPVDQIYFNSKFLLEEHNKAYFFPAPLKKECVVNLGIEIKESDEKRTAEIREKYKKDFDYLLLSAGRISPFKGYETLLSALGKLKDKHKSLPVKTLIVGSPMVEQDRVYLQYLEERVFDLNLQEEVEFLEFQNDILSFMAASDIFIHSPTGNESFGLTVGEAMGQKTLVIGSSQGGVADILINEETGFSFDSTSPHAAEELFEIIESLLVKKAYPSEKLETIKENAYKKISVEYTIQNMARQIEDQYKNL